MPAVAMRMAFVGVMRWSTVVLAAVRGEPSPPWVYD